jgi:hypothetical protein
MVEYPAQALSRLFFESPRGSQQQAVGKRPAPRLVGQRPDDAVNGRSTASLIDLHATCPREHSSEQQAIPANASGGRAAAGH